jgi:hypothetical protein
MISKNPQEKNNIIIMLAKKRKSCIDENHIEKLANDLALERLELERLERNFSKLQSRFNRMETLIIAYDLIRLFRLYELPHLDWKAITAEYDDKASEFENYLLSSEEFEAFKNNLNNRYPIGDGQINICELIELSGERHGVAYTNGTRKSIKKQEEFIEACCEYREDGNVPENCDKVFSAVLLKLKELQTNGQLKSL